MDTNLCANQAYSQGGPERLFVERPLPCGTWSHTHLDAHTPMFFRGMPGSGGPAYEPY